MMTSVDDDEPLIPLVEFEANATFGKTNVDMTNRVMIETKNALQPSPMW
jgi:hypothetical protein